MWTRGKFVNEYVPGLFAIAADAYDKRRAESMWQYMCEIKNSVKAKEENAERSGLGNPVLKGEGGGVTYDTEIAGPKQAWVHLVYALAVRITEEAIDDNLYELGGGGSGDDLKEIFDDLGRSMEENLDRLMARFLVNGAATTYHSTREATARALFYASHAMLDANTQGNYATNSDLTYLTAWTTLVAAENQVDHRQYKTTRKVQAIWIPPQMERKARETFHSPDRPDVANRAISAYKDSGRNIDIRKWAYLTDTDAFYYQLDGRGIRFFWRRKTRFAREKDFQTGDLMCKADQRWSAEVDDCFGWYGNIPA